MGKRGEITFINVYEVREYFMSIINDILLVWEYYGLNRDLYMPNESSTTKLYFLSLLLL